MEVSIKVSSVTIQKQLTTKIRSSEVFMGDLNTEIHKKAKLNVVNATAIGKPVAVFAGESMLNKLTHINNHLSMNVSLNQIKMKLFWYWGIDAKESAEDMNQSIEGSYDTNTSITKVMNTHNTLSPTIKKGLNSMETTERPVSYPVSNHDLKSVDETIEISSSQGKTYSTFWRIVFYLLWLSI